MLLIQLPWQHLPFSVLQIRFWSTTLRWHGESNWFYFRPLFLAFFEIDGTNISEPIFTKKILGEKIFSIKLN